MVGKINNNILLFFILTLGLRCMHAYASIYNVHLILLLIYIYIDSVCMDVYIIYVTRSATTDDGVQLNSLIIMNSQSHYS